MYETVQAIKVEAVMSTLELGDQLTATINSVATTDREKAAAKRMTDVVELQSKVIRMLMDENLALGELIEKMLVTLKK